MDTEPLFCPSRRLAIGIEALALYWPCIAMADCVDGVRKPTPGELEFHSRAVAALVAALPPAPAGVKLTGPQHGVNALPTIGVLCKEQKEGDYTVEASRSYLLELSSEEFKRRRAERTALSDQLYSLTVLPPGLKSQRDDLERQAAAGYAATDAARKAGDQAGAKARETEAHGFSRQAREIRKQHEDAMRPQAEEIRKRQEAIDIEGQKAAVRLAINVVRLPAANSALLAGAYGGPSPAKSASLKVQNVVWSVGGADTPLRQALAAAIDRARLEGLVGRPLPSASESEAFAAKAVPVTVAEQPATRPSGAGAPTAQAAPAAPAAQGSSFAPVPPVSSAPDPARKAVETVNQLRGLFGR